MPLSDSDDFESADEGSHDGFGSTEKKERKKRISSSNYSDSAQGSDHESKKPVPSVRQPEEAAKSEDKKTDGWDDFDIEENEAITPKEKSKEQTTKSDLPNVSKVTNVKKKQDTGWDDFDDWEQDDILASKDDKTPMPTQQTQQTQPDITSIADRLSSTTVKEEKSSGWGWGGWGVDSLLSSATQGISTITSHVSQGISTVLETGIGAPDPEELAKQSQHRSSVSTKPAEDSRTPDDTNPQGKAEDEGAFQFGSLLSGVTKFVESTGTKVIAGGLDTLETIGKKTMEVLQDGDPGLAKKRAMLGLDPGDKPVLSQVLREAKSRADEEDRLREGKREAKEVHYETLFDDYEGLVHLEALEMLSKQVTMRIEERLRGADADKRLEIKETLQQVAELCEMPDDEDEADEEASGDGFHQQLQQATQDLGVRMHFQPLVKHYTDTLDWLESAEDTTEKAVYKRGVSGLAQYTALSVEVYHKTAEMLLVKARRSTADEADAMTQMTAVLTKHISELATKFTVKLNSLASENKEQINNYITNVFLEAGNSSTYIQNAFQLALPILQIGAV